MECYSTNYEELKKLFEQDTEPSLEQLNKYDLKLEMQNNQNKKMIVAKEIKECIVFVIEKCNLPFDYKDIFDSNHILERYLLFKIQSKLLYKNKNYFDCDKTDEVYHFYNLEEKESTDTLLSLQSYLKIIFGKIKMIHKAFDSDSKEYKELKKEFGFDVYQNQKVYRIDGAQKFIYQLMHVKEIKEKLGADLYSTILRFIIYYHTIGNMSACPAGNYNRSKGSVAYDRLDLFKKCPSFKDYEKWFTEENIKKYCLEEIYEGFEKFPKQGKDETDEEYFKRVNQYLNIVIDIIKRRNINVINKYIENERI